MILPCMTMTTIRMTAMAAIRGATSMAMTIVNLMVQGIISMDTRPLEMTFSSTTTMTTICGESGAGILTPFLSLSPLAILLSQFQQRTEIPMLFCRFWVFLEHVHSSRVFPPSCITHIFHNASSYFLVYQFLKRPRIITHFLALNSTWVVVLWLGLWGLSLSPASV